MTHPITTALLWPALLGPLLAEPPTTGEEVFPVTAELVADQLELNGQYHVDLSVDLPGDINAEFPWSGAFRAEGERRPIVLVDTPDCVRLVGEPPELLITPEDFQLTYLRFPHGRRMLEPRLSIEFELVSQPAPDDRIAINVVGYLGAMGTDSPAESRFVRRRLELPLEGGATVRSDGTPAARSNWGADTTLQIGDAFPRVTLPDNTGVEVDLSEFVGQTNVLILFYRGYT